MNQLRCDSCEADLHGRDIDFSTGVAVCRLCGAPVDKKRSKRSTHKRVVPLPKSVDVTEEADGAGGTALSIKVPWRVQGASAAGELAAIIIVGGTAWAGHQMEWPWFITVIVVALVIGALVLVQSINNTMIRVAQGRITVRHAPIPWLSHAVEAASIEQLFVDRRPVAQKRFDYNVRAKLHDEDKPILLLRALSEVMVALYLEQVLEGHLQIVDRAMEGEYRHRYSQHMPPTEDGPPTQNPHEQAAGYPPHKGQAPAAQPPVAQAGHPSQAPPVQHPGYSQPPGAPNGYPQGGAGGSQPPPGHY